MRAAGKALTRPKPKGGRRGKTGAGDKAIARSVARKIAEDYLELCQHPAKDVLRWLAEDRKRPALWRVARTIKTGKNHVSRGQNFIAIAHGLCRHTLPAVRHGVDAHRQGGWCVDHLPARPRAGAGEYDRLRPLRAAVEGLARRDPLAFARYGGEADEIEREFRRKIDGLRGRLRSSEMSAAIAALRQEKDAAMNALRESQATERHAERHALRRNLSPARLG
jgi:hypothetical protein